MKDYKSSIEFVLKIYLLLLAFTLFLSVVNTLFELQRVACVQQHVEENCRCVASWFYSEPMKSAPPCRQLPESSDP